MVIDTNKIGAWAQTHFKIVVAGVFWSASWFSAVRCTAIPSTAPREISSAIEAFWCFSCIFFFICACVATVLVFDKVFDKVFSKQA